MKKLLLAIALVAAAIVTVGAAAPRSAKKVKSEQQATRREISETKAKIRDNSARTRQKLDNLNNLSARITRQEIDIDSIGRRVTALDTEIAGAQEQVKRVGDTVTVLRDDLKRTLRAMRTRRRLSNPISFLFSAKDFNQAYRRMGYLRDLNNWRTRKIKKLRGVIARLDSQRASLQKMRDERAATLASLDAARRTLEGRRQEEQTMIADLKKEGSSLNALLKEKQKRANELNRELDRIIAEEQRRAEEARKAEERRRAEEARKAEQARKAKEAKEAAKTGKSTAKTETAPAKSTPPASTAVSGVAEADRALSGSFEANRGRLLFPIAGHYTIVSTFGRSHHNTLSNIEVNNSGIDISVAPGTTARAVFDGTVSSVFFMAGFQNIVILRHGQYLTVYAGLTNLRVKKGDTVKRGATLGTVFTDTDGGEKRTILHFEVRRERDKLNPLEWVK